MPRRARGANRVAREARLAGPGGAGGAGGRAARQRARPRRAKPPTDGRVDADARASARTRGLPVVRVTPDVAAVSGSAASFFSAFASSTLGWHASLRRV